MWSWTTRIQIVKHEVVPLDAWNATRGITTHYKLRSASRWTLNAPPTTNRMVTVWVAMPATSWNRPNACSMIPASMAQPLKIVLPLMDPKLIIQMGPLIQVQIVETWDRPIRTAPSIILIPICVRRASGGMLSSMGLVFCRISTAKPSKIPTHWNVYSAIRDTKSSHPIKVYASPRI